MLSEMPMVPFSKSEESEGKEGKSRDDLVLLQGEYLLAKAEKAADKAGAVDFAEHFAAQDFAACSSALLQELKGAEDSDLLPLLVGVLGHIGGIEFADDKPRRRGAFTKSVQDSGQTVPEAEAFRRLRRAAFPVDAKTLVSHELGDGLDNDEISAEILSRFGFPEGRRGSEDLRRAMSDEPGDEKRLPDEPCGF